MGEIDVELLDEIELFALDDITPYEQNAKQHPDEQIQKIIASIRNYGWDVPVVIDEDGEIIKGHGRYEAAQRLDIDRVPAIQRTDLSEDEKRASRIADNKVSESEWEQQSLAIELDDLKESDEITGDMLGFDDHELEEVLDESWDDDLGGMDAFDDPDSDDVGDIDTEMSVAFEDKDAYDSVNDWLQRYMDGHDLDDRAEVLVHLADNRPVVPETTMGDEMEADD